MTRDQARQRIWSQVHASLHLAIEGNAHWLSHTRAPEYRPLPKRDRERMNEAAREILAELSERAKTL